MIDNLVAMRAGLIVACMALYLMVGELLLIPGSLQAGLVLCLFGLITALVLDTAVVRFVEGGNSDFLAVGGRLKVAIAIAIEAPGRPTWQMKAAMV